MEIIIIRQEHKPWGIDGHLYINRKRDRLYERLKKAWQRHTPVHLTIRG